MPGGEPLQRAQRIGRRVGLGVFAVLVVAFTVVCSVEIIVQVWWPAAESAAAAATPAACQPGLRGLIHALDRARDTASTTDGNERARVRSFRAALEPEWRALPAVASQCRLEERGPQMLRSVEELRYAEEAAVRSGSADLAPMRRRVAALEKVLR